MCGHHAASDLTLWTLEMKELPWIDLFLQWQTVPSLRSALAQRGRTDPVHSMLGPRHIRLVVTFTMVTGIIIDRQIIW